VRHPGNLAFILMFCAPPLVLGSLWALIPVGPAMCLMVVRTALEDRTLCRELAGYEDYTARVRYRLIPGIW
jgi:protein-S-isoprenylcysteine O-methyltransferase Ste14